MNRTMLLLLVFVSLLVVLTSWLSRKSEKPSEQEQASARELPDYYLNGLNSTITGKNGQPSHRMTAASLTHYPESGTTELKQPDITVYGIHRGTWHATANAGTVEGEQEIYLKGKVVLQQKGTQQLDLHTDWLRIDTAKHYAETDAPVRITSQSSRLQGIGMQVYGEQQRVLLRSAVRGQYAVD